MDAKHRHELKQNEFEQILTHFPQFCRDHVWQIVGVVLIIVAIFLWAFRNQLRSIPAQMKAQEQSARTQAMLNLNSQKLLALGAAMGNPQPGQEDMALVAGKLDNAAQEAKNPNARALLLIKQGDALRADLFYKPETLERDVVVSQITQAQKAYEAARKLVDDNPTLEAGAIFGIAICHEEIGKLDEAREMYSQIVNGETFAGTIYREQADMRLKIMGQTQEPVVFAEPPAPAAPAADEIVLPRGLEDAPSLEGLDLGGEKKRELNLDETPQEQTPAPAAQE